MKFCECNYVIYGEKCIQLDKKRLSTKLQTCFIKLSGTTVRTLFANSAIISHSAVIYDSGPQLH